MNIRHVLTSDKWFLRLNNPQRVLSPGGAQKSFFWGKSLTNVHRSFKIMLLPINDMNEKLIQAQKKANSMQITVLSFFGTVLPSK